MYHIFILFLSIELPLIGTVETKDITIALIVFFVFVLILFKIFGNFKRRKLRRIQLATKPYSTILETDEEFVSKSYERLYRGDIEGAIFYLDKAIKIKPEKEDRYIIRGNLKFKAGDFEGALMDFSRTISLDPNNASAHYQRGLAKKSLGLFTDAQIDFNTAQELGYTPPQDHTIQDTN